MELRLATLERVSSSVVPLIAAREHRPSLEEDDHLVFVLRIGHSADHLPAAIAEFCNVPAFERSFPVGFKVVRHIFHLRMNERIKEQPRKKFRRPNCQDQQKQLFVAHRCFIPV